MLRSLVGSEMCIRDRSKKDKSLVFLEPTDIIEFVGNQITVPINVFINNPGKRSRLYFNDIILESFTNDAFKIFKFIFCFLVSYFAEMLSTTGAEKH